MLNAEKLQIKEQNANLFGFFMATEEHGYTRIGHIGKKHVIPCTSVFIRGHRKTRMLRIDHIGKTVYFRVHPWPYL